MFGLVGLVVWNHWQKRTSKYVKPTVADMLQAKTNEGSVLQWRKQQGLPACVK
jgi:hypothetical protein